MVYRPSTPAQRKKSMEDRKKKREADKKRPGKAGAGAKKSDRDKAAAKARVNSSDYGKITKKKRPTISEQMKARSKKVLKKKK